MSGVRVIPDRCSIKFIDACFKGPYSQPRPAAGAARVTRHAHGGPASHSRARDRRAQLQRSWPETTTRTHAHAATERSRPARHHEDHRRPHREKEGERARNGVGRSRAAAAAACAQLVNMPPRFVRREHWGGQYAEPWSTPAYCAICEVPKLQLPAKNGIISTKNPYFHSETTQIFNRNSLFSLG